jgi:CTP synthase (UTP-ammonia lyase)
MVRIGLIGEYSPDVVAHRAIPLALGMASELIERPVEFDWLRTDVLAGGSVDVEQYDGLWCVPASPYASMEGALNTIRYARESDTPFLGTCGGFQHALIEYARNVLGIREADHAESNPDASVLFVTSLSCAMRGTKGIVRLQPGSMAARIYGVDEVLEEYNCSFGLNPHYRDLIEKSDLRISGVDTEDAARVIELTGHPFFLGTLYQPERAARDGIAHPLINAFVRAAAELSESRAHNAELSHYAVRAKRA